MRLLICDCEFISIDRAISLKIAYYRNPFGSYLVIPIEEANNNGLHFSLDSYYLGEFSSEFYIYHVAGYSNALIGGELVTYTQCDDMYLDGMDCSINLRFENTGETCFETSIPSNLSELLNASVKANKRKVIKGLYVKNLERYLVRAQSNFGYGEIETKPIRAKGLLFACEVEKEDKLYVRIDRQKCLKYGWAKEHDGSLDSYTGFELKPVSPSIGQTNLFPNLIKEIIDGAKVGSNCGGHINFSVTNESITKTINKLLPIVPFLVALYPKRLRNHYSDFSYTSEYILSHSKFPERDSSYSAICNRGNRIEFRYFPAVKNLKQLQFRFDLITLLYQYCQLFDTVSNAATKLICPSCEDESIFQKRLFAHLATVGINPIAFAARVETILNEYYKINTNELDF